MSKDWRKVLASDLMGMEKHFFYCIWLVLPLFWMETYLHNLELHWILILGIRQMRWNKAGRGPIRSVLGSVPRQFGTETAAWIGMSHCDHSRAGTEAEPIICLKIRFRLGVNFGTVVATQRANRLLKLPNVLCKVDLRGPHQPIVSCAELQLSSSQAGTRGQDSTDSPVGPSLPRPSALCNPHWGDSPRIAPASLYPQFGHFWFSRIGCFFEKFLWVVMSCVFQIVANF